MGIVRLVAREGCGRESRRPDQNGLEPRAGEIERILEQDGCDQGVDRKSSFATKHLTASFGVSLKKLSGACCEKVSRESLWFLH